MAWFGSVSPQCKYRSHSPFLGANRGFSVDLGSPMSQEEKNSCYFYYYYYYDYDYDYDYYYHYDYYY